jgi:hypothetical protein
MGMLRRVGERVQRLKRRGESFVSARLHGEALALSAEIPGRDGPLWRMQLRLDAEPHGGGERLRVSAHVRMSLRRSGPAPLSGPTRRALPARVGHWIERRLASPLVQRLAAPLLDRDFNTWLEVQTSSAPLDAGSHALLPDKLRDLGIEPRSDRLVESWAGVLPAPRAGFAQMTLVKLDKAQLPAEVQDAIGAEPFQLTAALVNVVEEAG